MNNSCVSCKTPLGEDIVIIGDQYPSAVFVGDEKDDFINSLEPSCLNVTKCPNKECGLVQLTNKYNLDYVFNHYPYESSLTATMKSILQDVVDDTLQKTSLSKDDVVLDIGGNDGTLLSFPVFDSVKAKVNIDAAAHINPVISDTNYIHIHSRFTADIYYGLGLPSPKLIFSIAMFYHLNDPITFCQDVFRIMSDDTIWVLQMTYLGTMLRDNIIDNIVHEHAAYYSLASLESLFSQVGLHIIDACFANSYGGSIRIFVTKNPSYSSNEKTLRYRQVQDFESEHQTNTYESLLAFNIRAQLLRNSIKALVNHIVQRYEPMWGFGASTKGNMLLQFLEMDTNHLSCILDNSPKKIGKRTMGSLIPIIDERDLDLITSYLFVLPYYYVNAFIPIIQRYNTRSKPIYLLVPLPFPYFINVPPLKGFFNNEK